MVIDVKRPIWSLRCILCILRQLLGSLQIGAMLIIHLLVSGIDFSRDVFGNPRLRIFVDPISTLNMLVVGCSVCYPMMWDVR